LAGIAFCGNFAFCEGADVGVVYEDDDDDDDDAGSAGTLFGGGGFGFIALVHVHVPKRLRVMPQLRDVLLLYLRVA